MSASSGMASHATAIRQGYYQLLRVSPTANIEEIKAAYRELAHALHPDKHGGCQNKMAEFRQIKHAYEYLLDLQKQQSSSSSAFGRSAAGGHAFRHRKVYATQPPPKHWKGKTVDHERHYQMHYGDGFAREAAQKAFEEAKQSGAFDYHSPLGKGFSFAREEPNGSKNDDFVNMNPYSKYASQGPPKMEFEYEEIDNLGSTRTTASKRQHIIQDMYNRRAVRQQQQQQQQRQQSAAARQQKTRGEGVEQPLQFRCAATSKYPPSGGSRSSNECVIM